MFSRKPTGFNATLKCYMSKQHGGCGKAQEAPVLLTHSHTTLLACLEELRNQIEQKHSAKCVTAAEALESLPRRQMFGPARASSCPTPSFSWVHPNTMPCEHIVAGATRARVCASEGMVQSWVGGGPSRCQVVHARSSQCGRRATLLWSQK